MTRNWLTYVAITASLIAGFLCSTAFADNKGMKFSGGNFNAGAGRAFSGGNSGGSSPRTMQLSQGNFGGLQNQIKTGNFGQALGNGNNISRTPIKINPILSGNGNTGNGQSGIGSIGRTPIKINPILSGNGNAGNGLGGIKIGNGGIKIGTGGNGQGNGNGLGITLGNNGIRTTIGHGQGNHNGNHLNKACHIAPKHIDLCFSKGCSPKGYSCSPCLKNWNPTCQPWWWTCHTHYCNQPVYYPVCTRPIVIQVPVYVEAPVQEQLVQVPVGSTITMQALGLGDVAGRLILVMDKVSLESQLNAWQEGAVTATLPMFSLAAPTFAELVIVRADGQPATSMKIVLVPAQVAAVQPAAVQPAASTVQQAQFTQPAGELSAAAALVQ